MGEQELTAEFYGSLNFLKLLPCPCVTGLWWGGSLEKQQVKNVAQKYLVCWRLGFPVHLNATLVATNTQEPRTGTRTAHPHSAPLSCLQDFVLDAVILQGKAWNGESVRQRDFPGFLEGKRVLNGKA